MMSSLSNARIHPPQRPQSLTPDKVVKINGLLQRFLCHMHSRQALGVHAWWYDTVPKEKHHATTRQIITNQEPVHATKPIIRPSPIHTQI